ncbi:helix-turn-helix transcriptional regulator [Streptomyces uncialis]|uniref:helix-turn-helix transcriptional regulator n=1 Tax=Streptomyces uncialis TaxID=1048205 RepID=UPI00378C63BD
MDTNTDAVTVTNAPTDTDTGAGADSCAGTVTYRDAGALTDGDMSAYEDVGEYGAPGGYGDGSTYGAGRAAGHSPPGATTPGERDAPGARPIPGTGTGRPGARLPFAGRAAQLGALERALRRPSCRAAVITGAPGVGKSRLAEEFLTRARHRGGHRVLRVQATDAARAMPLSALAPLLPYDSEVDGPAGFFAEVRRRAAAHRATAGPTVLVVDDIHLLDPTSLALLSLLLADATLFLAATLPDGAPWPDALRALWRDDALRHLPLPALTARESAALLAAAVGGPVAAPTARALWEASRGNPLLLRELLRATLAENGLGEVRGVWCLNRPLPETLPATVADGLSGQGLDALAPDRRALLELLAVCGPIGLRDGLAHSGPEVLAELEDRRLIVSHVDGRREQLTLAHPLHARVLRAGVSRLKARALLLGQAGRVRGHGARRAGDALTVACWELDATGTADPELLVRAAGRALHADDVDTMCRLARAALVHGPHPRAALMLGEALGQRGAFTEGIAVLERAFAAAGPEDVGSVAVTLAVHHFYGPGRLDRALAVLAEAVGRAGPSPVLTGWEVTLLTAAGRTDLAAHALAGCPASPPGPESAPGPSSALAPSPSPSGPDALAPDPGPSLPGPPVPAANPAPAFAPVPDPAPAPDPAGVLLLQARLRVELAVGRAEDAVRSGRAAYTAHRAVTERTEVFYPARSSYLIAAALLEAGRLDEADRTARDGLEELLAAPVPALVTWFGWVRGRIALDRGRPAEAAAHFREARAQAHLCGHRFAEQRVLAGLVLAQAYMGHAGAAAAELAAVAEGPDGPWRQADTLRAHAWALRCQGRAGEAVAVLGTATADALAHGERAAALTLQHDLVRWGERAAADRVTDLAATAQGPYEAARAAHARALAAADPDALTAVADTWTALGTVLLAAETLAQAASLWREPAPGERHRTPARVVAERRATARALLLRERCEGAATPALAVLTERGPGAPAALSARELEIAHLAARGRTSKEIAAHRGLSVRTVDNTLGRVYRKLGVNDRAALGRLLAPP